ncbi:uncharacterized protein KY384_009072 [Bacidia gigantensis]|uniref:uncharacterized protein n=1 Tax=Bacidia gigantensis TaxID=2732470 RepID=UPI001D05032D|nr:uncharacterized protein KY384_009072 [Bacidia gigantensis]KAG8525428.1 hypothetical protein KY384_009072 [Bacidia gigantensis]
MSGHLKRMLILGGGMVAPPCAEYLICSSNNQITKLAPQFSYTEAISLGDSSPSDLDRHISKYDIVISLVPCVHHANVIKSAIKSKTQVVTTSYASGAIRSLDGPAREAEITILSEVGVDPGVDHCYAIKKIDEVHAKGGKILEFYSYFGSLPAPECASNSLGLEFSWSSRGALLSQQSSARFLKDGTVVKISFNEITSKAGSYPVMDGYHFVAYPNRDFVPFRDFYDVPEAHTIIRGSLRYVGNPAFMQVLSNPRWLEQDEQEWLKEGMT